LKSVSVDVLPKKNVVIISSNSTPVQGFEKLLQNNILSAPVYDEVSKKYVGFLDVRDLVSYTVFAFDNHNTAAYVAPGPIYTTIVDNVTVTYLARRNSFRSVHTSATLYDVAELLAASVHRVPIVDSKGNIVSIISQSTLIQLFNKHLEEVLQSETNVNLQEIAVGTSPVISVTKDTSTVDTFRKMDAFNKAALAVVDEEGKLIGSISAKDLKLFIESSCSYDILKLPIMIFLNQIRSQQINIRSPSVSCNLGETLANVIGKLAATGVHRIYIVKSSQEYIPVRVISLMDVLKYVLNKTS